VQTIEASSHKKLRNEREVICKSTRRKIALTWTMKEQGERVGLRRFFWRGVRPIGTYERRSSVRGEVRSLRAEGKEEKVIKRTWEGGKSKQQNESNGSKGDSKRSPFVRGTSYPLSSDGNQNPVVHGNPIRDDGSGEKKRRMLLKGHFRPTSSYC